MQSSHPSPAQGTATAPMAFESSPNCRGWYGGFVPVWLFSIRSLCPQSPHFLTITLHGLSGPISEASLALGLCNSLFLRLLFFASFFKAWLNASSSRKPSWIHPLGSSPGLNMHNTRAEPPHGSTSCGSVLVASRKVRKGLSSLPVSLMLPDGVSHLRTEIFVSIVHCCILRTCDSAFHLTNAC